MWRRHDPSRTRHQPATTSGARPDGGSRSSPASPWPSWHILERRHLVGERGRARRPRPAGPWSSPTTSTAGPTRCPTARRGGSRPATTTPAARRTGAPARSRTTPPARPTSASTAPATCGSRRCATAPATGPRPASRPTGRTSRPPAGGVLRIEGRIQMPNVTGAAALGLLAGVLGARLPVPRHLRTGRASASSTSWRTSTASTPSGACCTAASHPGGPCNEFTGIGRQPGLPGQHVPVGLPHLPLRVGPQHLARTSSAGTSTASSTTA